MEFLRLGSKGARCLGLYDIERMSFLIVVEQTRFNNEEQQREIIGIIRI